LPKNDKIFPAAVVETFPFPAFTHYGSIPLLGGQGVVSEDHSPHRRQPGAGDFFISLLRKPGQLSYCLSGRGWLTWLSAAVITWMDRFTPLVYALAPVDRFAGVNGPDVVASALT
jgi:hypothetical protein